jgi:hypothetical protein
MQLCKNFVAHGKTTEQHSMIIVMRNPRILTVGQKQLTVLRRVIQYVVKPPKNLFIAELEKNKQFN